MEEVRPEQRPAAKWKTVFDAAMPIKWLVWVIRRGWKLES